MTNPDGVTSGVREVEVDGAVVTGDEIALRDDGAEHVVRVTMGQANVAVASRN